MRRLLLLLPFLATTAYAQFGDTITVSRVLLDARVTNAHGEPITDLKPEDFTVRIGGAPARVASATWTDETDDAEPEPLFVDEGGEPVLRPGKAWGPGRLIVVFVQTDFQRANLRMQRQMAFRTYAEEIIHSFDDDDRIAVFSFDSHLKFRCDLTTDKEEVIQAMRDSIAIDDPPAPRVVPNPSLARHLDREEMKRAVSSEAGMLIVANALRQLEGPKTMLLLGWGLGVKHGSMTMARHEWPAARRALQEARVTVVALNQGLGGELSYGMELAAKDTGGMYAFTPDFPHQVTNRVRGTMLGRWELELDTERPLRAGTYAVDVRVKRRGAVVLAPSSITIQGE